MDLLPTLKSTPRGLPSAASWILSSEIRLQAGFASARRLMMMGFYNMALSRQRLAFMVTTEQEALEALSTSRPGLLIVTPQLERGSGLALVEQARSVVNDIRTILVVDGATNDLVSVGRSQADAVLNEADCFGEDQPIATLIRSLSLGQRYRSRSIVDAMETASAKRKPWREQPPDMNARELEMVALLVQGLGDRQIAESLEISYETARSRGKAVRRKLGANTRTQVVAKAIQLGLAKLGAGRQ